MNEWICERTFIGVKKNLMLAKSSQLCPTLCDPVDPTRLLCPWDSPGKNTGVGYHILLQGIFLTQGSNPSFLCLWEALKELSHCLRLCGCESVKLSAKWD